MLIWYHWGDPGRITESAWQSDRKGLPGSIPKMEEMVGPVSTCGWELLRGWWQPMEYFGNHHIFLKLLTYLTGLNLITVIALEF
jgi:hypothetical protein